MKQPHTKSFHAFPVYHHNRARTQLQTEQGRRQTRNSVGSSSTNQFEKPRYLFNRGSVDQSKEEMGLNSNQESLSFSPSRASTYGGRSGFLNTGANSTQLGNQRFPMTQSADFQNSRNRLRGQKNQNLQQINMQKHLNTKIPGGKTGT